MAFVNEYIPEEDFEKYEIREIDRQAPATIIWRRDWTIDRERDIYLRQVSRGYFDADETHISWWTFYWKGTLLWFRLEPFGEIVRGEDGLRHGSYWIKEFTLPESLQDQRQAIYQDLRDAFNIYGGGGVLSASTDYVYDLEFV